MICVVIARTRHKDDVIDFSWAGGRQAPVPAVALRLELSRAADGLQPAAVPAGPPMLATVRGGGPVPADGGRWHGTRTSAQRSFARIVAASTDRLETASTRTSPIQGSK